MTTSADHLIPKGTGKTKKQSNKFIMLELDNKTLHIRKELIVEVKICFRPKQMYVFYNKGDECIGLEVLNDPDNFLLELES